MGFSEEQHESIYLVRIIFGAISLFCNALILSIYCSYKELHSFFMRLIMYLVWTDALNSFSVLLPSYEGTWCYIQAVLIQFSTTSGIFWSLLIGVALYKGIASLNKEIENKIGYFMLFGFGPPAVLTAIPAAFGTYGRAGGWCWIDMNTDFMLASILRLTCFYGPLVIIIFACIVIYIKIIKSMNKYLSGFCDEFVRKKQIVYKMIVYPSILIICYLPIFILRILDFIYSQEQSFILTMVCMIFSLGLGIFNFIAYGLNGNVREVIQNSCQKRRGKSRVSMSESSYFKYNEIHTTF